MHYFCFGGLFIGVSPSDVIYHLLGRGVTLTYLDVFGGLFIGAREKWWHMGFQFIICQQSHYIPLGFLCARVCGWRGKDCLKWRHRPYHRLTSPTCTSHPLKGLLEMRLKCNKKNALDISRLFSKRYELTHMGVSENVVYPIVPNG